MKLSPESLRELLSVLTDEGLKRRLRDKYGLPQPEPVTKEES